MKDTGKGLERSSRARTRRLLSGLGLDCILPARETQEGREPRQSGGTIRADWEDGSPGGRATPGSWSGPPADSQLRARRSKVGEVEGGEGAGGGHLRRQTGRVKVPAWMKDGSLGGF